jgi:hemolysin activation/secretion protein
VGKVGGLKSANYSAGAMQIEKLRIEDLRCVVPENHETRRMRLFKKQVVGRQVGVALWFLSFGFGCQAALADDNAPLAFQGLLVAERDITKPQPALQHPAGVQNEKCPPLPNGKSDGIANLPALADDQAISSYRAKMKAQGIVGVEPSLATLDRAEMSRQLQPLVGKPLTQETITKIHDVLLHTVNNESRLLADIYFPPQKSEDGYVVAVVAPARVGKIKAEGQRYYDGDRLACEMRNLPGNRVDILKLAADLQWLNRTPWRVTDSSFSPGDRAGEADILLSTNDRRLFRPYMTFDNTGTRDTGLGRYRVGFSLGNPFGLFDHRLDYSYTISSIGTGVETHSLAYTFPTENRTNVTFSIAQTAVDVMLEHDTFHSHGTNTVASLTFNRVFEPPNDVKGMLHEGTLGFEYKREGSQLSFGQTSVSSSTPEVFQIFTDYSLGLSDTLGKTNSYTHLVLSPGLGLSNNTDEEFNRTREGARSSYWYLRQTLDRTFQLPAEWSARGLLTFQYTPKILLWSERLNLTGMYGVRGYYEDSLYADSGLILNLELATPTKVIETFKTPTQLQGFVFADWGKGYNKTTEYVPDLKDDSKQHVVSSLGVGFRLTTTPYVQFNGTLGWATRTLANHHTPDYLAHLSLVIGF